MRRSVWSTLFLHFIMGFVWCTLFKTKRRRSSFLDFFDRATGRPSTEFVGLYNSLSKENESLLSAIDSANKNINDVCAQLIGYGEDGPDNCLFIHQNDRNRSQKMPVDNDIEAQQILFRRNGSELVHPSVQLLQASVKNCLRLFSERESKIQMLESVSEQNGNEISRLKTLILQIERYNAENSARSGSYLDSSATPEMLELALKKADMAAATFIKVFYQRLQRQGFDLALLPAMKRFSQQKVRSYLKEKGFQHLENLVHYLHRHDYARSAHIKFALQSWTSNVIFAGFENDAYSMHDGFYHIIDRKALQSESWELYNRYSNLKATEMIADKSNIFFGEFCYSKYVLLVPEEVQKRLVQCDFHSCTLQCELYSSFLQLAKHVWLLHKLARTLDPGARIFRVSKGMAFDGLHMESVASSADSCEIDRQTVELMVMPGFQIRNSVIKSSVYLGKKSTAN